MPRGSTNAAAGSAIADRDCTDRFVGRHPWSLNSFIGLIMVHWKNQHIQSFKWSTCFKLPREQKELLVIWALDVYRYKFIVNPSLNDSSWWTAKGQNPNQNANRKQQRRRWRITRSLPAKWDQTFLAMYTGVENWFIFSLSKISCTITDFNVSDFERWADRVYK